MQYIAQPNGSFFPIAEDSDQYQRLSGLPEGRRPAFLAEDAPAVVAWLQSQPSAIESARQLDQADLLRLCNTVRQAVAKSTHYLQSSRWPVQLAAAQDVLAHGEAAQPLHLQMIDLEARLRARGETREQLAQKVISNSGVFTLVGAAVDGIETATLDALRAYAGSDPAAFTAIVAQARLDLQVELVAIFTPTLGEPQALALVAQILVE